MRIPMSHCIRSRLDCLDQLKVCSQLKIHLWYTLPQSPLGEPSSGRFPILNEKTSNTTGIRERIITKIEGTPTDLLLS